MLKGDLGLNGMDGNPVRAGPIPSMGHFISGSGLLFVVVLAFIAYNAPSPAAALTAGYTFTSNSDWSTGTFANSTNSFGDLGLNWTFSPYFAWQYRKPISISGSTSALTDYQVNVTIINETGRMNANYTDIRFTDGNDVPLPYWCENCTRTTNATFWVKVPSIPTTGTTIYAYYGNPFATDAQNGTGTFEFFDDFEGQTVGSQPTGWTNGGNGGVSVSNAASRNGANSMAVSGDNLGDWTSYRANAFNTTTYVLELELYPLQASGALGFGTNIQYPMIQFGNLAAATIGSGKWGYYDTTWQSGVESFSTSAWTSMRVKYNGSTADIYRDGALKVTAANVADGTSTRINVWGDATSGGGSELAGYMDIIRVRKYAYPEPSATPGTEEARPTRGAYRSNTTSLSAPATSITAVWNGTYAGDPNVTIDVSANGGVTYHALQNNTAVSVVGDPGFLTSLRFRANFTPGPAARFNPRLSDIMLFVDSNNRIPPCDSFGDIDNDGSITYNDTYLIAQAAAGILAFTAEQSRRADVNGDGTVNPVDGIYTKAYTERLADTFPICTLRLTNWPLSVALSGSPPSLACSAISYNGTTLKTVTLYTNFTGFWSQDQTRSVNGTSNSTVFQKPAPATTGSYSWNCLILDSAGLSAFAGTNATVSVQNATTTIQNVSSAQATVSVAILQPLSVLSGNTLSFTVGIAGSTDETVVGVIPSVAITPQEHAANVTITPATLPILPANSSANFTVTFLFPSSGQVSATFTAAGTTQLTTRAAQSNTVTSQLFIGSQFTLSPLSDKVEVLFKGGSSVAVLARNTAAFDRQNVRLKLSDSACCSFALTPNGIDIPAGSGATFTMAISPVSTIQPGTIYATGIIAYTDTEPSLALADFSVSVLKDAVPETGTARNRALSTIKNANDTIMFVDRQIADAEKQKLDTYRAATALAEARGLYKDALSLMDSSDYEGASFKATDALTKAQFALTSIPSAPLISVTTATKEQAEAYFRTANDTIIFVDTQIALAERQKLPLQEAVGRLAEARGLLKSAQSALSAGDYKSAADLSTQATALATSALQAIPKPGEIPIANLAIVAVAIILMAAVIYFKFIRKSPPQPKPVYYSQPQYYGYRPTQ